MAEGLPHHDRRSMQVPDFDYSESGAYFVTIVSHKKRNFFGNVRNGVMRLSQTGEIVDGVWLEIPQHFPKVTNEIFVIMPNYIHGIIVIDNEVALPKSGEIPGSVGEVVGSSKSAFTKRVHIS